jgi:hypothetical protein
MSSTSLKNPTWEIAHLFPAQGTWSEEEYLGLSGNRLVEFSDGFLEVLPLPTTSHQALVAYLYGLLFSTCRAVTSSSEGRKARRPRR